MIGLGWITGADVAVLNSVTGALEGTATVAQSSGAGSAAGDAQPPAVQGLLRLITSNVVAGRLLRGRLFLPGSLEASNTSGQPSAGYRTAYETPAAALIADANTEWQIWSQTHGVPAVVQSANVWTRWAVLRSRRD